MFSVFRVIKIIKVVKPLLSLCLFVPVSLHADNQWDRSLPIQPVPFTSGQPPLKVALGKKLFNDPRLSRGNVFSCASCHQLFQGGDDGLERSLTNKRGRNSVNTPTVFNSRYNFKQTWGGYFKTLEEQVEGGILHSDHGNSTWLEVLGKLQPDQAYQTDFNNIYADGINKENILDAIASYERSLITPNSRFDQYLRGDSDAITENEKRGYKYFKEYGCVACHQGVNVGGNMYQKFGLFDDYFKTRGNITVEDYGLFNVTGDEKDKFVFRVPGLRNIEVTGPYLHDGSVQALDKVVNIMARYQLGTTISEERVKQIVSFLKTLTGEYEGKLLVDMK